MQTGGGDDFLATAGFALDQDRKGRIGILLQLQAQFLDRRTVPQQGRGRCLLDMLHVQRAVAQRMVQDAQQGVRRAGLGDEIGRTERAGMAGIVVVTLAGKYDDARFRRSFQQLGNQRKAFVGAMRMRRQAEIDQRQFRRAAELPEQLQAVGARMTGDDLEGMAQRKAQGVGNERVVIDNEQQGLSCRKVFGLLVHVAHWKSGKRPGHYAGRGSKVQEENQGLRLA